MSKPVIVEVSDLTVTFDNRRVLDSVSLSIMAGSFSGLIGPNGAGKTTFMKILLGQLQPNSGRVMIFGHPPGQCHGLIGYVPQSQAERKKFPITVREVVLMGRYAQIGIGRRPKPLDHEAVADALVKVGIESYAHKHFAMLSGGERQKVLIARAICSQPRLLLLDEPTTGVDVPSQDNFYRLLHSLIDGLSMTILLVSHDIGVITRHVDNLICLNQKIFCHAPPETALANGLMGQVYGAEMEIIMHGHDIPHRTLKSHEPPTKSSPDV